ncbi:hypothetical protein J6590_075640, partial [Homalodisca vitripennis]
MPHDQVSTPTSQVNDVQCVAVDTQLFNSHWLVVSGIRLRMSHDQVSTPTSQ